jgi:P4 family phage/plasmid primase-like protien
MDTETPFQRAARAYFDSGWSPIPLPHQAKSPVPDHPTAFTGARGAYVDSAQLRRWLGERARAQAGNFHYPPSNIAIRLPKDIIGIDVDAYGEKRGAETLAKAEEEWGGLPATWVSTSKRDGLSGIRLFRIPEGLSWPGQLPQGKGVELLRWDHRYMMVAPSVHDLTGEEYRWCREEAVVRPQNGDGNPDQADIEVELRDSPEEFPDADASDIPALPEAWVEGLTSGKRYEERAVGEDLSASEIQEWLAARPEHEKPCSHMRSLVSKGKLAIQKAGDDGGAHDVARDAAWGALNDAKAGHSGISKALGTLRAAFLANVKGRRDSARQAATEWARIVERGIAKVEADGSERLDEDPCNGLKPGRSVLASSVLGGGDIEELNGMGDNNRVARAFNGNVRWVPGWEAWAVWQGTAWSADSDKAERLAWKAMVEIEKEAELVALYEDGEAMKKRYLAHRKSRLDDGKVRSILRAVRVRPGIRVDSSEFDANPRHLACANGVLELGREGVCLIPATAEMYITKNTGVVWKPAPGAGSPMWDDFLERFLPDLEVRDWLQRITGYSLLGHNNARHIVALVGETSCGKSTYAEVIRRVLGDYGSVMTSSVLRESNDDKARPDMLTVFGSRIAISDEVGRAKKLHADQVKRITGAVPIKARGMRSNEFVVHTASFTPWIVGNTVPEIEGHDLGLERRLLPVPFDVQIKHADEKLDFLEELLAEGSQAILAWCVEGYEKWLRAPRLEELPLGAVALSQRIREESSDFGMFCAEKLDDDKEAFTIPSQAYEAYQQWCAEGGIQQRDILSLRQFGMSMTSRYGERKSKKLDGGKVVKGYKGVRIVG